MFISWNFMRIFLFMGNLFNFFNLVLSLENLSQPLFSHNVGYFFPFLVSCSIFFIHDMVPMHLNTFWVHHIAPFQTFFCCNKMHHFKFSFIMTKDISKRNFVHLPPHYIPLMFHFSQTITWTKKILYPNIWKEKSSTCAVSWGLLVYSCKTYQITLNILFILMYNIGQSFLQAWPIASLQTLFCFSTPHCSESLFLWSVTLSWTFLHSGNISIT